MTLPMLSMSSFILSYFGVLAVSLFLYKSVDIAVSFFRKNYE